MSEETGKSEEGRGAALAAQVTDRRALGRALVEGIDRMHAERGRQVAMARELRMRGEHAEREAGWERVQELTLQIEQSEKDMEALGGRAALMGLDDAASKLPAHVSQMIDSLDMIAEMPAYDAEAGVTVAQLIRQYDEAREMARLAVACYERGGGDVSGNGVAGAVPLLRDPDSELPDDGFHVVVVTGSDDERLVLAYHDAGSWLEVDGDDCLDGSVIGWCWQDEAAEALGKAVRS